MTKKGRPSYIVINPNNVSHSHRNPMKIHKINGKQIISHNLRQNIIPSSPSPPDLKLKPSSDFWKVANPTHPLTCKRKNNDNNNTSTHRKDRWESLKFGGRTTLIDQNEKSRPHELYDDGKISRVHHTGPVWACYRDVGSTVVFANNSVRAAVAIMPHKPDGFRSPPTDDVYYSSYYILAR